MTGGGSRRAPMIIGDREFAWGARTWLMGIVNVTPDSFSGDGLAGPDASVIVQQARRMVTEGADLLDIGGESTRPGHVVVPADTELARVIPAVEAIRAAMPDIPLSVDTTKPTVAADALRAGADLLNDVGGVTGDGSMARIAGAHGVPYVLMHDRDLGPVADVAGTVLEDLSHAIGRAVGLGCPERMIIVDPGIGFGKSAHQNLELLRDLHRLTVLGRPILLGASRKSTIGRVLELPPDDRLEGTLATTAVGITRGADIVRVHDVRANQRVARMTDAIVRGWPSDPQETCT